MWTFPLSMWGDQEVWYLRNIQTTICGTQQRNLRTTPGTGITQVAGGVTSIREGSSRTIRPGTWVIKLWVNNVHSAAIDLQFALETFEDCAAMSASSPKYSLIPNVTRSIPVGISQQVFTGSFGQVVLDTDDLTRVLAVAQGVNASSVSVRIDGGSVGSGDADSHMVHPGPPVAAQLPPPSPSPIIADPAQRFQTIYSWDGVAQIGQDEFAVVDFLDWRDDVVDKCVNELGLTGVRLEVRTGMQHSTDYWTQWQAGTITMQQYNQARYLAEAPPAPIQMSKLDWEIDEVLLPIDVAMGGTLKVNVCVIDFDPKNAYQHRNFPNDYAAFILAIVDRLVTRFGRAPDSIEIVNEPNLGNPQWTTTQIKNAIVATHDLLATDGHNPLFIAPSDSNTGSALGKIQTLMADSAARSRLDIVSYHRYGENTADVAAIAAEAAAQGKMTSMNEKIGVSLGKFFEDLIVGNNSMWQKFAIAFPDGGSGVYYVINSGTHVVTAASATLQFAKVFKNVPPGSVRIGASSTDATITPLAFEVPGGAIVKFGLKNNVITIY